MTRMLFALACLAACTDEPDPCAGIARCLAVRVEPGAAQGSIATLELGITIGDTQSIVTRATNGAPLPVVIPIELPAPPVVLDLVALARTGASEVAAGSVQVEATDERTDATLELQMPLACIDGGYYCGGDKLYGDPDILYTCRAGRVPALRERCARGCVVAAPGTDDACAP